MPYPGSFASHSRSSLARQTATCTSVPTAAPSLQLVEKEVPGKFVGSVQQVVELGLKLLHEMAGKAQFYRDRLAQVGGLGGGWDALECLGGLLL